MKQYNVAIFHNILWPTYKGAVFSALWSIAGSSNFRFFITHIADTEKGRVALSAVDYSYHEYPFNKVFEGCYEDVSLVKLVMRLFTETIAIDADLVILPGYHRPEYWAMLFACIVRGTKRAVFCDSTASDRPKRWINNVAKRWFFSMCDGYFCYGERSREYLLSLGAKKDRIFTRCQAAALAKDYDPQRALEQRVRRQSVANSQTFLYVGRLSKEKGLEHLIAAFAGVHKDFPNARLRIVGAGPMADAIRKQIAARKLEDAVTLVGSLHGAALSTEYYDAACLILPSVSEPWGLVVNEALSHGCPALVSQACGCVPELIHEGVTGYHFPVNNTEALAIAMRKSIRDFADRRSTAYICIDKIEQFTPYAAARSIMSGCDILMSGERVS
jgi:glycosyltransferase involved in cell wall biosynthesis